MTERAPVTAENREISRVATATFGGAQDVHTWWDSGREHSVDILTCDGTPDEGLAIYATLNLSNHPLKDVENDLRVELVAACPSDVVAIPQMLSTCAFNVIINGAIMGPGVVLPGALSLHAPETTVPHILFTPPVFWAGALRTLVMANRTVAWLLALPITDAEFDYVKAKGYQALVDLIDQKRPNLFDIQRPSVV